MEPSVRSTASDSIVNITTPVIRTAGVNISPTALLGHVPLLPLPQHVITSGTRKDCIRLRGLPYKANVEHILKFLGEHSKNILFQGVPLMISPPFSPLTSNYSPFSRPPPLIGHQPQPSLGAPYPPPILYWPYPTLPISPPHQQPAQLIMQGPPPPMLLPPPVDMYNRIHSVSEWNIDYMQQNPQFCSMNVGPMGMHSAVVRRDAKQRSAATNNVQSSQQ